jgi:hypothetical protein
LSDGLEFIVAPDSKAIKLGAGVGDDGADGHGSLVYLGHDIKHSKRGFGGSTKEWP